MQSKPTITLATNTGDPALELREIELFADGSGFSAMLYVRCHGFSAVRQFYCGETAFDAAIAALRRMDERLEGEAVFHEDYETDQSLRLSVNSLGHVRVSGALVHFDPDNRLTFQFDTDQTCLGPLIRAFDALRR